MTDTLAVGTKVTIHGHAGEIVKLAAKGKRALVDTGDKLFWGKTGKHGVVKLAT